MNCILGDCIYTAKNECQTDQNSFIIYSMVFDAKIPNSNEEFVFKCCAFYKDYPMDSYSFLINNLTNEYNILKEHSNSKPFYFTKCHKFLELIYY